MSKVSFIFALFLVSLCTETVAVGKAVFDTLHGAAVEIASSKYHTILDRGKFEGVKCCLDFPGIKELMPQNLSEEDIYWLALVFPEVTPSCPITVLIIALRQAAKLIAEGIPVTMDVKSYASDPNVMSQIGQEDTYWLATLPEVMEVLPTDSKTKVLNEVAAKRRQGQQDFPNINVASYAGNQAVMDPISQENTYWLATLPGIMDALTTGSKIKALNEVALRLSHGEQCPPNINVVSYASDQAIMNPIDKEPTYWLATIPGVMNALPTTSKIKVMKEIATRLEHGEHYSENINVLANVSSTEIWNGLSPAEQAQLLNIDGVINTIPIESAIKICKDGTLACFRYNWQEKSVEDVLSRVDRNHSLMSDALIAQAYSAAGNGVFKTFSRDTIGGCFLVKPLSEYSLDEALGVIAQTNFEEGKIRDATAANIAVNGIKSTIQAYSSSTSMIRRNVWNARICSTIEAEVSKIIIAGFEQPVTCMTQILANEFNSRAFRNDITSFIIDAIINNLADISETVENKCFDFFKQNWFISEEDCRSIAHAIGIATSTAATTDDNIIEQSIEDINNAISSWKNSTQSSVSSTIRTDSGMLDNTVTVNIAGHSRNVEISSWPAANTIVDKLNGGKNSIAQAIVKAIINHTDISEAARTACSNVLAGSSAEDIEKVVNAFKDMVTQAVSETGNVIKDAQNSVIGAISTAMSSNISTDVIVVNIGDQQQSVVVPDDDKSDITSIFTDDGFKTEISRAIVDAIIGNKDIGQYANDACFRLLRDTSVRSIHFGTAYNVAEAIGQLTNTAKAKPNNAISNAVSTAGEVSINNVHRLYLMGAMYAVMNKLGIPQTNPYAEAASSGNPLITTIDNMARVAPWDYGGGVTDNQRRSAALNLLKIAQTLK